MSAEPIRLCEAPLAGSPLSTDRFKPRELMRYRRPALSRSVKPTLSLSAEPQLSWSPTELREHMLPDGGLTSPEARGMRDEI
jgi:hypothetical protein